MERRSFIQVIVAFLTSFFGRFTRLGKRLELARVTPTGPRGIVSSTARWYSPTVYTLVESVSGPTQERLANFQPEGFPSPSFTTRDHQQGYVVMHLRNPAIDPRHKPAP